jgi:hypothetical protein
LEDVPTPRSNVPTMRGVTKGRGPVSAVLHSRHFCCVVFPGAERSG